MKAKKSVKEDDFAIKHVRLVINKNYFCKILYDKYEKSRKTHNMKLDSEIIIDAAKYGSIAKYINHSYDLNY